MIFLFLHISFAFKFYIAYWCKSTKKDWYSQEKYYKIAENTEI